MAYLIGWGSPFDADDHTYKVFGTDKGANYSSYSNALVDQYLIEARESADPGCVQRHMTSFRKSWQKSGIYTLSVILMQIMWQILLFRESQQTLLWDITVSGIFWNVADWTIRN